MMESRLAIAVLLRGSKLRVASRREGLSFAYRSHFQFRPPNRITTALATSNHSIIRCV
ncbi:hypothetical protein [Anabaena sp. CA = ATCC 33047]|uniref:hypothetical protein n=1 Tax=Anabaena sp. (strain CA / ATCC 33047) TaxID=52271 RepID=UPI0012EECE68|nr:hypothetical protein [Anabaena sp. CA = ATCC 33047]